MRADDPIDGKTAPAVGTVTECDRLAASPRDPARPSEAPGVAFDRIDSDAAIAACKRAILDDPRDVHYWFNLGRAYQKAAFGTEEGVSQSTALAQAQGAYEEAAQRGHVSALYNLALLYEMGDAAETDIPIINNLLQRAAQGGHSLAMSRSALRYRDGTRGLKRDSARAYEWFAKAAERGVTPSMVEHRRCPDLAEVSR